MHGTVRSRLYSIYALTGSNAWTRNVGIHGLDRNVPKAIYAAKGQEYFKRCMARATKGCITKFMVTVILMVLAIYF